MKIGFLGNTNNYPFIVASQMRELGCEVVLYIDAPIHETLNRPEYFTSKLKYPYPDWIKENFSLRNSLFIHFPNIFLRKIIKELNTCDAVILNDYGHRFKNFISPAIPSISMFSGADLEVMGNLENVMQLKMNNKKLRYFPAFLKKSYARYSVKQLRSAISKASLISYFPKGLVPSGDRILHEIFKGKPFERFSHLHVITEGYEYHTPADNGVYRIFSFTRFIWKPPFPPGLNSWENKGNDIMLKGIALFYNTYKIPLDIHLIEKGIHLNETKELIQELGITNMITWHKEMPFRELQNHIIKSDVVFEQLGTHFISGGLYAMLMGRPVIGNANPRLFDEMTGEPTPVCHATSPEEVCNWLQKLTCGKELGEAIGKRSRQYVLDHFDIMDESRYFKNFIEVKMRSKNV